MADQDWILVFLSVLTPYPPRSQKNLSSMSCLLTCESEALLDLGEKSIPGKVDAADLGPQGT
jgi:hypothetical protein